MNCKYCGLELPASSNPRREFCNDAHKQAYWRAQHQADQNAALLAELEQLRAQVRNQVQEHTYTEMLAELVVLRAQVRDQAREIEDLQQANGKLHKRLDYEQRYLEDNERRGFKSWLKKQPSSPLIEKLLTDTLFPPRDTRRHYEYYLKLGRCSEDEMQEFARLWKLMLLQS